MNDISTLDRLEAVARITGHRFANPQLLEQGLTHASACSHNVDPQQRLDQHNERLEFLGDAMLGAAMSFLLYRHFPGADEGFLSRCKSQLVSRKTLAKAFDQHGLMDYVHLGTQLADGVPSSVRANLAEGLLGAIYMDGGWPALRHAVEALLHEQIHKIADQPPSDAKNTLQMWCLEHHRLLPSYRCERCGGSDHAPLFRATVGIAEHEASAEGGSRRSAEARAAALLLDKLSLHDTP